MNRPAEYDVVIIGGSYSGLSAALTLARALRTVLIIDAGNPCNAAVKHSHNFLTHDGHSPALISQSAREQLQQYENAEILRDEVNGAVSHEGKFRVMTVTGATFDCKKLLFATGITDVLPPIPGMTECWAKSVLHCPYCHGYEVKNQPTGVLATSGQSFEYAMLLANWTTELHVLTNGTSPFSEAQLLLLAKHNIALDQTSITHLNHVSGELRSVRFSDGRTLALKVLYSRVPFIQKSALPQELGCELDESGYIRADLSGKTSINGIYACGDNTSKNRTISNAVAMGTNAGMAINKELTVESY